jgi:hypothetical protein
MMRPTGSTPRPPTTNPPRRAHDQHLFDAIRDRLGQMPAGPGQTPVGPAPIPVQPGPTPTPSGDAGMGPRRGAGQDAFERAAEAFRRNPNLSARPRRPGDIRQPSPRPTPQTPPPRLSPEQQREALAAIRFRMMGLPIP